MNANGPERPVRLLFGSLDVADAAHTIEAHYNPKDIDLAYQSNWVDEGSVKSMVRQKDRDVENDIQYTGTNARTMSLELFLDDVEPQEKQKSIDEILHILHVLASPRNEQSDDPKFRRPHLCVVAWGNRKFRPFHCVIETLTVKFTMFSREGHPLRAVCTLKLKEVRAAKVLRGAA
jgi:Contractile injection system tube protein